MKTRMLSLLLALALLCALLPQISPTARAETFTGKCGAEGDNITWTYDLETRVLTLSGTGAMDNAYWSYGSEYADAEGNSVEYHSAKQLIVKPGVTAIGDSNFEDFHDLENVSLPNTLTSIGYHSFGWCFALEEITLPASLTALDREAFTACFGLKAIHVDAANQVFSSQDGVVFSKDKTTLVRYPHGLENSYVIPNTVTAIGDYAFHDAAVKAVTIPEGVKTIGEGAFWACYKLTEAAIPKSVTAIGIAPFAGSAVTAITVDAANPNYSSENGVLFNKARTLLLQYPTGKDGAYTIPGTVTRVEDQAFYEGRVSGVVMPASVREIGKQVFSECYELESVKMTDNVTEIGTGAFESCSELKEIRLPASLREISDSLLEFCTNLSTLEIPNGVIRVGDYAFHGCWALREVSIPDTVLSIGEEAFCNMDLRSIHIPDSVTEIGPRAFCANRSLTEVRLPANLKHVAYGLFIECDSLTRVFIPAGIETISYYTFYMCDQLREVFFGGPREDWPQELPVNGALVHCGVEDMDTHWELLDTTATCTQAGEGVFGCACGYSKTEQVPALGHEFDEHYICCRCGKEATAADIFKDVKNKDYYAEAVLWAVKNGITTGVGDGRFGPKQPCAREQVATFLWAAESSPEPGDTTNPFKDVKKKNWFYKPVLWAVENGVTGGVDETHFGVGAVCDRAQVVTFLWALAGNPEPETTQNPFTDVKKKDYFYKAVLWAVENGVTGGTGDGSAFSPKEVCTRAQVVTFLYAALANK